jgi:hypothetical protein
MLPRRVGAVLPDEQVAGAPNVEVGNHPASLGSTSAKNFAGGRKGVRGLMSPRRGPKTPEGAGSAGIRPHSPAFQIGEIDSN